MTITPGYTFVVGETITEAKLNLLGAPTGVLTSEEIASVAGQVGATVNLFRNPDLGVWTRGAGPVNCPVTERTYLADEWFARPKFNTAIPGSPSTTVACYYQRETDDVNNDTIYRARVGYTSGASDEMGDWEFGQKLTARRMAELANNGIVTVEIENQTGAAFTPTCRLYSCDVAEVYTAVTAEATVTGVPVSGNASLGNGERRTYTFAFTTSGYVADLKRGGEICLVVPEGAATLAGYVRIYGILQVEAGSTATTRKLERDPSGEDDTTGSSGTDAITRYFVNGGLSPALFASDGGNLNVTTTEVKVAHGWLAITAAGTAVFSRDTATLPDTASGASLKVTGAVGVDVVRVRQRVYSAAAKTALRSLAWSAYVRNGTGAALSPVLNVYSCNAADDFNAVTARVAETLTSIGDGDWVRLSHVFDASALTDMGNGFVVELAFAAGTLNAGTKTVRIAQAELEAGLAASDWTAAPVLDQPVALSDARNLRISVSGDIMTITADAAVLEAKDGTARRFGAVSCTCELSVSGAGGMDTGAVANTTEYYLWLCGGDGGVVAVCSLSGTAPTVPAGYPFLGRISNFYSNSSAEPEFDYQLGKVQLYQGTPPFTATYTPVGTGLTAVAMTRMPSTAVAVGGTAGVTTSGDEGQLDLAGNASALGGVTLNLRATTVAFGSFYACAPFRIRLTQVANWYFAAPTTGSPSYLVQPYEVELA